MLPKVFGVVTLVRFIHTRWALLRRIIVIGAIYPTAAAASNIEWITNAGLFHHDLIVTTATQEEKINVYGNHLTVGVALSDWEVSYNSSNSSGYRSDDMDIDYENSGSSIGVSRYIPDWRFSVYRYSGISHLDLSAGNLSNNSTTRHEKQAQTSLSLELGRSWYKNQWSGDVWSGLSSLTVHQKNIVKTDRLISITQEDTREKIFLIGGFAGYSMNWQAANSTLQPGISFDYQRHIAGSTNRDRELQDRTDQTFRSVSQSLSPDSLQWSTLTASISMTNRYLSLSLLHQYPLNKPHERYSAVSASILF